MTSHAKSNLPTPGTSSRRVTRRELEKGLLAAGTALVAGCHEYHPSCAHDVGGGNGLDGYEPRFLTFRECVTVAAVAEVMIAECPPVISAAEVARRADQFLSRTEAPAAKQARFALWALGSLPDLDLEERKKVLDDLIRHGGLTRDVTRVLKLMTVVPYYSHPEVRRAIGFVDFEQRERIKQRPAGVPLPMFLERRAHPEPEQFG